VNGDDGSPVIFQVGADRLDVTRIPASSREAVEAVRQPIQYRYVRDPNDKFRACQRGPAYYLRHGS
jgi:hypothetical protein